MPALDFTNRKLSEERNKLPTPTNEGLKSIFVGVEKVLIKDGGVYEDKAMSDKVLLTLTQDDNIQDLCRLLEIDETNTGFYCMCLGTYAIELYTNDHVKDVIGFHHGVSIRYANWNGDAGLAKIDELLIFLSEQGLTKPLEESIKQKRNNEADKIAESRWLELAPRSFRKYWTQMLNVDDSFFPTLITDLDIEFPDRQKQIIALLQLFGKTEKFWTGYPAYEEVPKDILETFEIKDIIQAYLSSDRNYKTRRGLGRLLCSFELKKRRRKILKHIPLEVIDDLENCFDNMGDQRGTAEISRLKNEKNKS